jgi:hypothetical protein
MTSDRDIISEWFNNNPTMNYGVCPSHTSVIIDLDNKPEADGVSAFEFLAMENSEINTFTVRSPSGGLHLYLNTDKIAGNAHRFPKGIDVRGIGGYVVGPGSQLIEGLCKPTDTPGPYVVVNNVDISSSPKWITDNLQSPESKSKEIITNLDTPEAVSQGLEFLKHRDPAVEGLGGDEHTYVTAVCLMDFGLSAERVVDLLIEPYLLPGEEEPKSWNDRCVPPWDIHGRKGTLEEKARNAWEYRSRDVGIKSGAFSDEDIQDAVDVANLNKTQGEERFARIKNHLFRGGAMLSRGKKREYVIPEWLPAHGFTALLSKRGGGKTTLMIDMALSIASDKPWYGVPVKEDFYAIYICGEDDEGAEDQIRAWCKYHGMENPPDRFLFLDIITNLMDATDCREWAEFLKTAIGPNARAVVFLDTWQRASSYGGQNKDEDMQKAVHHAEAIADSLRGPAVIAFHPPKHDSSVVMGSSVIENSTSAIWSMSDYGRNKKLEVTRIKGKGEGNYHLIKFNEVSLGLMDDFDNERTGIVPIRMGGVEQAKETSDFDIKETLANIIKQLEIRRIDSEDEKRAYTVSKVAKILAEELPSLGDSGDGWASMILKDMNSIGLAAKSWRSLNDIILELFGNSAYDYGDGTILALSKSGKQRTVSIEKGGIAS